MKFVELLANLLTFLVILPQAASHFIATPLAEFWGYPILSVFMTVPMSFVIAGYGTRFAIREWNTWNN